MRPQFGRLLRVDEPPSTRNTRSRTHSIRARFLSHASPVGYLGFCARFFLLACAFLKAYRKEVAWRGCARRPEGATTSKRRGFAYGAPFRERSCLARPSSDALPIKKCSQVLAHYPRWQTASNSKSPVQAIAAFVTTFLLWENLRTSSILFSIARIHAPRARFRHGSRAAPLKEVPNLTVKQITRPRLPASRALSSF